ncbi:Sulfotransferase [Hyella patelloides LEGE 07179]|uniref:Sulfotransferase n=1 Tax=Hyella patelloides LEGE 07179 TaxID=945734 RepID=A0A563VZ03_9CYAN|nr:sulfotransferase [Hyella patelloides]VEP16607.1 Sulfotransferase [Hyella patelloides LEGE 07179]
MTLPNFLIIGAAKAGTTSLYKYLEQHPDVYMSSFKEPGFFAFEGQTLNFQGPGVKYRINKWTVTDLDSYQEMFAGAENQKAIGEATPLYLYYTQACDRIKHYIPDAKLIAMLRDPVERAFSNYVWAVQPGAEPITNFTEALAAEPKRINDNWGPRWHYKAQGFYYQQLKPYFETFDPQQIRVYLHQDFVANPKQVLQDIFNFLEIDDSFELDLSKKHNVSQIPRNKTWHEFINKPNPLKTLVKPFIPLKFRTNIKKQAKTKNLYKPKLNPEVRQQLIAEYQTDILQLQELINRDLSQWLKV